MLLDQEAYRLLGVGGGCHGMAPFATHIGYNACIPLQSTCKPSLRGGRQGQNELWSLQCRHHCLMYFPVTFPDSCQQWL